jgi:hypothetical protein
MTLLKKTAESIPDFLGVCAGLVSDWSTLEHGELTLWYRGQKSASWHLTPGEYRYPQLDADEIRSEFILKSRELVKTAAQTDWEWYFIMQHYGLPTRLLDWTSGSLIGLHFALRESTGQTDAAVWVIDPWALNGWSTGSPDLIMTGGNPDPIGAKYLRPVYKKLRMPSKPIAIIPPYNSQRITAQRSAFTVHGSSRRDLDSQFKAHLARITIPSAVVLQMRRQLRSLGISEFSLFPDLDGLSRDIRAMEVDGC